MGKNKIIFRGTVSKVEQVHPKMASIILDIVTVVGEKKKHNFPRILCFGENVEKALKFEKGDKVTADCYVRDSKQRYKAFNKETGERESTTKTVQQIVASEIKYTENIMQNDFDIGTGKLLPDENKVMLDGTILFVKKHSDILADMLIRIDRAEGKYNKIKVSYFMPNGKADLFVKRAEPGKRVCVLGNCQTDFSKKPDGKVIKFETLVAKNVYIAPTEDKVPEAVDNLDINDEEMVEPAAEEEVAETSEAVRPVIGAPILIH